MSFKISSTLESGLKSYGLLLNRLLSKVELVAMDYFAQRNYVFYETNGEEISSYYKLEKMAHAIYASIYDDLSPGFFQENNGLELLFTEKNWFCKKLAHHYQKNVNNFIISKSKSMAKILNEIALTNDVASNPFLKYKAINEPIKSPAPSLANSIGGSRNCTTNSLLSPTSSLLTPKTYNQDKNSNNFSVKKSFIFSPTSVRSDSTTNKHFFNFSSAKNLPRNKLTHSCSITPRTPTSNQNNLISQKSTTNNFPDTNFNSNSNNSFLLPIKASVTSNEILKNLCSSDKIPNYSNYAKYSVKLINSFCSKYLRDISEDSNSFDYGNDSLQIYWSIVRNLMIEQISKYFISLPRLTMHEINGYKECKEKNVNLHNIQAIFKNGQSIFYLTEDKKLYSEGFNQLNQLGYTSSKSEQFSWNSLRLNKFFSKIKFRTPPKNRSEKKKDTKEPEVHDKDEYFKSRAQFEHEKISLVSTGHSNRHGYLYSQNTGNLYRIGENLNKPKLCYTNLKIKLSSIECGRDHSLFLDTNGKVYASGEKIFGVIANNQKHCSFDKIYYLRELESVCAKQIACTNYCSFILDIYGDVFCFGYNSCGECSLGNVYYSKKIVKPTRINYFTVNFIKIRVIKTAGEHVGFMDTDNQIYLAGNNTSQQISRHYCSASNAYTYSNKVADRNRRKRQRRKNFNGNGNNNKKVKRSNHYFNQKSYTSSTISNKFIYYPNKLHALNNFKTKIVNFELGPKRTLLIDAWNNIYTIGHNIYTKYCEPTCQVRMPRSFVRNPISIVCLENSNIVVQNLASNLPGFTQPGSFNFKF